MPCVAISRFRENYRAKFMTSGYGHQTDISSLPTRRSVIRSLVGGSILMPGLLSGLFSDRARGSPTGGAFGGALGGSVPAFNPLAPRPPHFGGRAKRVIFMYMSGGVSHMDSFDPK